VFHCFCWRESSILVVHEHLVEEVNTVIGHSGVVVHVHERLEGNGFSILNQFDELFGHVQTVLSHVFLKVLSSHNVDDFDELVVVVSSLEEGIGLEHEAGHSTSDSPHVEGVVVLLVLD